MIGTRMFTKAVGAGQRVFFAPLFLFATSLALPLAPTHLGEASAQDLHLLVVAGLGGDPEYRAQFLEWGTKMTEAAGQAGVPSSNIIFLAEDPQEAPQLIDGRSTRIEIERVLGEFAREATLEDQIMIVLMGHGGGSGAQSRVSLAGGSAGGGSLTATDYARLLDTLSPRRIAFVNLASSSGDFVPVLASAGRVVVTATRSASQRNAPLFGGHFVEAYSGTGADLDRDGRISVIEAFEYARQETERYYREAGLIATEHALIEDRAGGSGVVLPMDTNEVGATASRFYLQRATPATTVTDPEMAVRLGELYAEQERLENTLAELGQQSASMGPQAYQEALQPLLVEIARIGQEIRRLEGEP